MTNEEAKDILDTVKKAFNHFKEQVPPMVFAVTETERPCYIMEFTNEKSKQDFAKWLSTNVLTGNFKRFAFVSESYVTQCEGEKNLDRLMEIPAQERPNTKEVIFIVFSSPTEEYTMSADITRDDKGVRHLGEFVKQVDATHTTGRFVNLYKKALSIKN